MSRKKKSCMGRESRKGREARLLIAYFEAVTAKDIQRVVKKYFVLEKSTVGYFIPKDVDAANQVQILKNNK